ncbi:MAG: hypothetical protein ACYC6W_11840 [Nitrosotalea sp.]
MNTSLSNIHPDNYRLYVERPEKDFSPERNRNVINQVISENDSMQKELQSSVKENAGNVADILSSFAKYKLDKDGGKQLEQWMGKEGMKKIYGPKLLEKIRMMEVIKAKNRKDGNTKFENYYLT